MALRTSPSSFSSTNLRWRLTRKAEMQSLTASCRLRDEGATVVYTSHYMEEVEQICSRIMIMDGGKILALGTAR